MLSTTTPPTHTAFADRTRGDDCPPTRLVAFRPQRALSRGVVAHVVAVDAAMVAVAVAVIVVVEEDGSVVAVVAVVVLHQVHRSQVQTT